MLARPLITAADRIAFCSNGLHALKAREYLLRQDPALARRLIPAHEYRFGEMMLYKPIFAAVGLWKLMRLRSVPRGTSGRGA